MLIAADRGLVTHKWRGLVLGGRRALITTAGRTAVLLLLAEPDAVHDAVLDSIGSEKRLSDVGEGSGDRGGALVRTPRRDKAGGLEVLTPLAADDVAGVGALALLGRSIGGQRLDALAHARHARRDDLLQAVTGEPCAHRGTSDLGCLHADADRGRGRRLCVLALLLQVSRSVSGPAHNVAEVLGVLAELVGVVGDRSGGGGLHLGRILHPIDHPANPVVVVDRLAGVLVGEVLRRRGARADVGDLLLLGCTRCRLGARESTIGARVDVTHLTVELLEGRLRRCTMISELLASLVE